MSYSKITLRYAAAFFDLVQERGLVEVANKDMLLLGEVCASNRDLVRMFQNPVVNADRKQKVIGKIFAASVNPLSLRFMDLMVRKRRERYLPSIAEAFSDLYKESIGVKTAYVTSAISLEAKEKKGVLDILTRLTDKKIDLVEKTNPGLIGGFVINMDNYQVDQSLTSKIKELRKDFERNLFVKGF